MSGLDPNAGGALVVPGGGTSLPTATGANQIPQSDGAGTSYAATDRSQVVIDGLSDLLGGDPAGTVAVSDGAGGMQTTSAPVAALLSAADLAAMRAVLAPVRLLTSANATVTDASPAGAGSAAIDSSGVITLTTDPALPSDFAAGPKVSLALSGDAGSRFRARVRLVSTAGPSSDSYLALYFRNATGMGVFARINGQIGVWDLGGGIPAIASVTALWDGTEYLEIRSFDGLVHFGVWQGTTWLPIYTTSRNDAPSTVGVVLGSVSAASTQTVVLDGFRVTDLRAW